jgi:hypothetical protein
MRKFLRAIYFIGVALLALIAVAEREPHWPRALLLLTQSIAFTATLAIGAVHAPGHAATFCLGALVPAAMAMLNCFVRLEDWGPMTLVEVLERFDRSNTRVMTGILWASSPVIGAVCVATRRLFFPPTHPPT